MPRRKESDLMYYAGMAPEKVKALRLPFNQLLEVIRLHNTLDDIIPVPGNHWTPEMFLYDIAGWLKEKHRWHYDPDHLFEEVYSPAFGKGHITSVTDDGNLLCYFHGRTEHFDRYGRLLLNKDAKADPGTECLLYPHPVWREWTENPSYSVSTGHPGRKPEKAETRTGKAQEPTRLVPLDEAAAILGVDPETVRNYARAGLLHKQVRNKRAFIPKSELTALTSFPELNDISRTQGLIDAYRKEMDEKYTITKQQYEERRKAFLSFVRGRHNWSFLKALVDATVRTACADLTEKELRVVGRVLEMDTLDEIAEKSGLTYERIRQIYMKAVRKIGNYGNNQDRQRKELNERIKELETRIQDVETKAKKEHYRTQKRYDGILEFKTEEPYILPIPLHRLNTRTRNILLAHNIETYGDLCSYTEADINKLWQSGKQTRNSLKSLLEEKGLAFGMWRDPDRKY